MLDVNEREIRKAEMHFLGAAAGYRMTDQIFICRRLRKTDSNAV
jgi:hypothetical protein